MTAPLGLTGEREREKAIVKIFLSVLTDGNQPISQQVFEALKIYLQFTRLDIQKDKYRCAGMAKPLLYI